MLHLLSPKDAPLRQTFPNQPRQIRFLSKHLAVAPESQRLNPQHLLRRGICARDNPRGVHHHQPRRHIARHFFAQPLRMLGALAFDLVKPLQLFLLVPELPDYTLHRRRHERGRIFGSRRRHRDVRPM